MRARIVEVKGPSVGLRQLENTQELRDTSRDRKEAISGKAQNHPVTVLE
jgi:hypothetical protein